MVGGRARALPRAPGVPGVGHVNGSWPRHRAAVLLGALAGAALLVDLGSFHRLEQGDSIVPVLVSLQRWTPFFWDQERYGMLVPLLALPIRDPLWNLLFQRGALVLAGLGAVVLLARHVLAGRDWPLAGVLSAGALVAAAPAPWLFEYLGDQPYGLSLLLALAGLAVAEPGADGRRGWPRLALGFALVAAAHWVNAATGVLLLGLVLARVAADRLEGDEVGRIPATPVTCPRPAPRPGGAGDRARARIDGALLLAGLAAGQVFLRLWPVLTSFPLRLDVAPLPLRDLPAAWGALLANTWRDAGRWPSVLLAAAAAGLALLSLPPLRPRLPGALLRAAALAAAALAYALFAGSLRWVQDNAFHWRYLAPSALLVHLAALSLLAEPLARLPRLARPAALAALALLPVAALAAYGPPSPAMVRADLDRVAGRHTADVLASGCELVAGDYWSVWPAVWHAALVSRERGEPRAVWGVSHRTNATVMQWWAARASLRICRPLGEDAQAERWMRSFHLWPTRVVERRATLDVLAMDAGVGGSPVGESHTGASREKGAAAPVTPRPGAAPRRVHRRPPRGDPRSRGTSPRC
jgi:hypothetical protein